MIFDILDAKEAYEDIADFMKDGKRRKPYKNERRLPFWVAAILALGGAASLLIIALDWISSTGDLKTVRVQQPTLVADVDPGAMPAPETERAAKCARDPFLDICK
ncbi:MAG: hypothetical protein ACX930_08430 [Erythrobacter sp.]